MTRAGAALVRTITSVFSMTLIIFEWLSLSFIYQMHFFYLSEVLLISTFSSTSYITSKLTNTFFWVCACCF